MQTTGRLGATAFVVAAIALTAPARAEVSRAPDVAVFAEPTLRPALDAIGAAFRARTGAPIRILCAPSAMLVREIPHTRVDVVVLQGRDVAAYAAAHHAADAASLVAIGRNHLVVARRGPGPTQPLASLVPDGAVATVDAAMPDALGALTKTALERAAWPPAGGRAIGVARDADAAFLLTTGAASHAVLYATDLAADTTLSLAATLPDPATPIVYVAGLSADPSSPYARAFVEFLATPQAAALLQAAGLAPPQSEDRP